jgi:ankyrin repeat protein
MALFRWLNISWQRDWDPNGGANTGMNAFHWAANRGQLEVVIILIQHHAALEVRNMYGGTVLSATVWSALNERKSNHIEIIDALLKAGARIDAVDYPSGDKDVDEVLRRFGHFPSSPA